MFTLFLKKIMADNCDCPRQQEIATEAINALYDIVTELIENYPEFCYELADRVFAVIDDINHFEDRCNRGCIEVECAECKSDNNS